MPIKNNYKTLTVDKWNGRLTRFRDGDINSGMGNFYVTWGTDTFARNGTLTFSEGTTDIKKGVVTDLVMAGKLRVESAITYLYCIGHTGRLYKVQVNNPATHNPNYDTPVLLTTLTNSQTFKFGSSLDFYKPSATEFIYIGHDTGVTYINFDGTGETNLTAGWTANVPRQQVNFVGSQFFTDGSNLSKIDSSNTVTHNVLSPGFPANTQARDIDLTADGRYMVVVSTRNPIGDMTLVVPNSSDIASMPSQLYYWNGTDSTISSSTTFPSFSMTSYQTFSQYEYLFGYQVGGAMLGTPKKVILVDEFTNPPFPNAVGSSGDFLAWGTTNFNLTTGHSDALLTLYGTIDQETPVGQYRQLIKSSTLTGGDVVRMPFFSAISSWSPSGSTSGYTTPPFNLYGTGKSYFSTLEYDGVNTTYGFYMFSNVESYLVNSNTGVYETQHQLFSGKIKPIEVRVYFESPGVLAGGIIFKTELVGIDGAVLTGSANTFTPSTSQDSDSYNPNVGATSALGLRITNVGIYTPYIHKVEIDYTDFGQK